MQPRLNVEKHLRRAVTIDLDSLFRKNASGSLAAVFEKRRKLLTHRLGRINPPDRCLPGLQFAAFIPLNRDWTPSKKRSLSATFVNSPVIIEFGQCEGNSFAKIIHGTAVCDFPESLGGIIAGSHSASLSAAVAIGSACRIFPSASRWPCRFAARA